MCRVNLPVISFEPPPGGPMAATNNWKITRTATVKIVSYMSQGDGWTLTAWVFCSILRVMLVESA